MNSGGGGGLRQGFTCKEVLDDNRRLRLKVNALLMASDACITFPRFLIDSKTIWCKFLAGNGCRCVRVLEQTCDYVL